MVAHRGAGKTIAVVNDDIRHCATKPNQLLVFLAPEASQVRRVAWPYVQKYTAAIPGVKLNQTTMTASFSSGSHYMMLGAENYDALRGLHLNHISMDEPADFREDVWPLVIRPALAQKKASATWIGTPKGDNWFKRQWDRAATDHEYGRLMLKSSEAVEKGWLDAAEVESARRDMTPGQFAQEMECSFEAADSGGIFTRDMFAYYDSADLDPKTLWVFGASDYATGRHDYTVHGIFGHTKDGSIYVLDWWRENAADSARWAMVQHVMAEKWRIRDWLIEAENISRSVGPFLRKMMQEQNYYYQLHDLPASGSKIRKSASIRARMSQRMIKFPAGRLSWVDKLEYELLAFNGEPSGTDDQVDVLSLVGRGLDLLLNTINSTDSSKKKNSYTYADAIEDLDKARRQRG